MKVQEHKMKKLVLLALCFGFMQAGEQVICKNRNFDYLFRDDIYFKIYYNLDYYYGDDNYQTLLEDDYEEPLIVSELINSKLPELAKESINEAKKQLLDNGDCKKVAFTKESE